MRRDPKHRTLFEPSRLQRLEIFLLPASLALGSLAMDIALTVSPKAASAAPAEALALHLSLFALFFLLGRVSLGAVSLPKAEISPDGLLLSSPLDAPRLIPWDRLALRRNVWGNWRAFDSESPDPSFPIYSHWPCYQGLLDAIRERAPGALPPQKS